MSDVDEYEMMGTAPRIASLEAPERKRSSLMRLRGGMLLSRWLLFLGSLVALGLVFLPWVTIEMQADCRLLTCGGFSYPLNPFNFYLTVFLYSHPNLAHLISFQDVMLIGCFAPGILCSIWIHGRIQTIGQRLGLVTFSLWTLLFTGLSVYATYHLVAIDLHRFERPFIGSWAPSIGLYLLALALVLLWCGLLLVWREMFQTPVTRTTISIQQQAPLAYGGAALVTGGLICWFIGYYGIYWLLPADCPPTPLFGSAPCNDRLSAQRGYELLFQGRVPAMPFFSNVMELSYWTLGIVIVFGGVALLFTLWTRHTSSSYLPLIATWATCLVVLMGVSYWGTRHLAVIYPDEQWTNGLLTAVLGLLLIAAGLLVRWQTISNSAGNAVKQRVNG